MYIRYVVPFLVDSPLLFAATHTHTATHTESDISFISRFRLICRKIVVCARQFRQNALCPYILSMCKCVHVCVCVCALPNVEYKPFDSHCCYSFSIPKKYTHSLTLTQSHLHIHIRIKQHNRIHAHTYSYHRKTPRRIVLVLFRKAEKRERRRRSSRKSTI